jgi:hypothetical protein
MCKSLIKFFAKIGQTKMVGNPERGLFTPSNKAWRSRANNYGLVIYKDIEENCPRFLIY